MRRDGLCAWLWTPVALAPHAATASGLALHTHAHTHAQHPPLPPRTMVSDAGITPEDWMPTMFLSLGAMPCLAAMLTDGTRIRPMPSSFLALFMPLMVPGTCAVGRTSSCRRSCALCRRRWVARELCASGQRRDKRQGACVHTAAKCDDAARRQSDDGLAVLAKNQPLASWHRYGKCS